MERECSAAAEAWLASATDWDGAQRRALARIAPELLARLPDPAPWLLALGGPPGTGKSTLARLLAHLWKERWPDQPALQVLSLDDYYLPRAERRALAARVHPLFARRGVPGTHDLALLASHVAHLRAGDPGAVKAPVFDKGRDDRAGRRRVIETFGRPSPVVLEGWFAGTPPEPQAALAMARSRLEREADGDRRWRRAVNDALARFDAWLQAEDALRWHLAAPSWAQVLEWRWAQERELPPERRMLGDRDAVADFLAPFERIARHQFESAGQWADLLVVLDTAHRPHLQSPP